MNKQTKIVNGENFTNKKQRIINGTTAGIFFLNKYNFYCGITSSFSNVPYAGGSYIGKNIIITAAHVVYGKNNVNNIKVRFNKKNLHSKGLTFNVKEILIHPKYDNYTLNNDIALLYLDKNPKDFNIKNIFLPSKSLSNQIYNLNKPGIILGYGVTDFNTNNQPNQLKYSLIKILNKNKVKIPKEWLTSNMITAGDYNDPNDPNDNEDTCQGDSGGPLFGNYGINRTSILMGITSWGIGCGLDNYPGVYTKVGNYTNWVYNNWNYDK